MEDQNVNMITTVDPYKALNIVLNPDGTLARYSQPPLVPIASSDAIVCTDIPLNPAKNTFIRVFQPPFAPSTPNLPLIIFFHGGGFIVFSASSQMYHESCIQMARELPAVVLSVEYRLAPESRLPSAYEDALEAIRWVNDEALTGEHKFFDQVDFSKCFVMGSSAGANITYQVGLQASKLNLEPLKINGLIMIQPFFGGLKRSDSELRLVNDSLLPLSVADLMWELALPVGADRDHEYCNPLDERVHSKNIENIKKLPRCYVRGHGGDPLLDRQKKFAKMLKKDGVLVVEDFTEDGFHACELFDQNQAQKMVSCLGGFIHP